MPNSSDDDRYVCVVFDIASARILHPESCFDHRITEILFFADIFFAGLSFFINTLRNVFKIINKLYCTFYAFACLSYDHAGEGCGDVHEVQAGPGDEERQSIWIIENKSGKRKWKERETSKNNIAKMSRLAAAAS